MYPLNAVADEVPFEWIEMALPISTSQSNPRANMRTGVFTQGQRNIAITGKFGYCELADVPSAIKIATAKIVGAIIKENIGDADLKEVTQESIGQYSTSYAKIKEIANAMGVTDMVSQYIREDMPASSSVSESKS